MTTRAKSGETAFQKSVLGNGLRVVTSAMPQARSVSICIFVGVGSRYELPEYAGVSHIIEHLVFKGTKRRPSPREISGVVEGVGGIMNAGTEREMTVYWCQVARPYLEDTLDLLIDMLRNSLYEPAEIDRERMVVIEEQNQVNDYPNYKVDAILDETLWPNHPLGQDISGTRESVSNMTRGTILDHVSQFYTPSNIVVSVAGNVDHDQVLEQVNHLCDGWTPHPTPRWTPFVHVQSEPQLRTEYRKTEQAHLSIGLPGLSMTHPDRYALDLIGTMLGEGMSSRLFLEIRERQGLAYDIHSSVDNFQDCGAFIITAGVDAKRVYTAVEAVLAEVRRMREGVPSEDVDRAKRLIAGRLLLKMEDTRAVSSWIGSQEMLVGRVLDVDEVTDRFEGVTPEDIRRVSNELLRTEKLNMVVVGPYRGGGRLKRVLVL